MKRKLILFCLIISSLLSFGQSNWEILPTYSPKGSLSLRTNAFSCLMITPSIGAEYKLSDHLGLIVEGEWSHWTFTKSTGRYWRMLNVAPQARYYFEQTKDNYIRAQYTIAVKRII